MRKSNCLIWAITQFVRHGGYVTFRRGVSFRGCYVHFLWAKTLQGPWYSYQADYEKAFPWPFFKGRVVEGDTVRELHELQSRLGDTDKHGAGRNSDSV